MSEIGIQKPQGSGWKLRNIRVATNQYTIETWDTQTFCSVIPSFRSYLSLVSPKSRTWCRNRCHPLPASTAHPMKDRLRLVGLENQLLNGSTNIYVSNMSGVSLTTGYIQYSLCSSCIMYLCIYIYIYRYDICALRLPGVPTSKAGLFNQRVYLQPWNLTQGSTAGEWDPTLQKQIPRR